MDHLTVLMMAVCSAAQAEPDAQEFAKQGKAWLDVCSAHVAGYEIRVTAQPQEKLRCVPKPIFRHAQVVRGGQDIGAVWLWIRKDTRPAAVGTVFCWDAGEGYRWMAHEFHSLADEPLAATWRGRRQWTPTRAGVEWQPVPDAPLRASSRSQQRQQIHGVARRLRGHSIDHNGGQWQLRLIPKPVYRYQTEVHGQTLDGALYVMCQGTDPEVFLIIEARSTDDGLLWHYACAAFSDYQLHVQLGGTDVWATEKGSQSSRTGPHWWNGFVERTRLPSQTETSNDQ
jgi:hypothetical protein